MSDDSPWSAGSWGNLLADVGMQMSPKEAAAKSSDDELKQLSAFLYGWADAITSEQARRSVSKD